MDIEEMEREHEKSLLALEQEIEGWKSANRILKAKLEQAENAFEKILEVSAAPNSGYVIYEVPNVAKRALKAIREG